MKEQQFPENDGFPEEDGFLDEDLDLDDFAPDEEEMPDAPSDGPAEDPDGFEAFDVPLEDANAEDEPFWDEETNFPQDDPAEPDGPLDPEEFDEDAPLFPENLESPALREELNGDDNAMYEAGLTHPEDAAFHYPAQDEVPLENLYQDEPEAPSADPPRLERPSWRGRTVRKGRPRRKKGSGLFSIPQMAATVIWLLVIVAIGVSLGRTIWVCAADVLAFGRESQQVTISITTDDTMESIAEKLHSAGLIRYEKLFLFYADLSHAERKITTGTFTLNTLYDYNALVKQMSPRSGNRNVVEKVLIPEGYSCRQIFARLEEKGVCKAADLEQWAANGELGDYWFLQDVARGSKYCLEGYLFPATYDFYENSTPKEALTKMLDAFEANFKEELYSQLPALNERISQMMRDDGKSEAYIAQNQLSLHQLITVASLIEKETAGYEESPKIASVIYNRLFSWGDTPRYLNIDASVIYALDGKTDLTAEDMAVDSPYNTYTNTGITPGPISNPGIASLKAALNPEDTPYFYYVLNPETGEHTFSKTYEEHQELVEQYRNMTSNE